MEFVRIFPHQHIASFRGFIASEAPKSLGPFYLAIAQMQKMKKANQQNDKMSNHNYIQYWFIY